MQTTANFLKENAWGKETRRAVDWPGAGSPPPQGQGMRRASHDRRQTTAGRSTHQDANQRFPKLVVVFLNLQIGMNVKRSTTQQKRGLTWKGPGEWVTTSVGSGAPCVVLLLMEEGRGRLRCRWAPGPCPGRETTAAQCPPGGNGHKSRGPRLDSSYAHTHSHR